MAHQTRRIKLDKLPEKPPDDELHSLGAIGGTGGKASVEVLLPPPNPEKPNIDAASVAASFGSEEPPVPKRIPRAWLDEIKDAVGREKVVEVIPSDSLVFTPEQRLEIIRLFQTNDPESLMRHFRELVSAHGHDADGNVVFVLRFTAQQLERIASRCAHGETLEAKAQEYADYGVDVNIGLR
jgi:hypothetical protein